MEPACAVLEISPSTYYAAKKREEYPSARDERDEELKMAITRAREKKGRRLYGAKPQSTAEILMPVLLFRPTDK